MSDPVFARVDEPMPQSPRRTVIASLAAHLALIAGLMLATLASPPLVAVDPPAMIEVARIELPPPDDEPIGLEKPIPPEELSGYELSGLPFNMAKIAARRESLFPFLTADLSFLERLATDVRNLSTRVGNPLDPRLAAPPLELSDRLRQHLVDEAWARRDRWQRFAEIATLLRAHDAHAGEAPALVRAYLDQNLLQPYCHGRTRDGQFWALLENASDHVAFLEFIRAYVRTRSSSRTTTELLFLVDELAQASREAAATVMNTDIAHDLVNTAVQSPPALRLANDVAVQLRRLGSASETREGFARFRLRVLATIVETSPNGYRESDARFLAGDVLYRQGDLAQAIEWWRLMKPQPGDSYFDAAAAIAAELRRGGTVNENVIRRVLSGEVARWHAVNYERLKHFGYRCDSY